jgi:hypothetical protein
MESLFKTIAKELYTDNKHKGYLVQWKLVAPFCKKWSRNRDPDMGRVAEMRVFNDSGGYIPKVIHLAEVQGEGVVCYDGNHRRELLNELVEDDITCIVDIMFGATQNDVYVAFENINKSVQVPIVYIEENGEGCLSDIIHLVKTYETNYKPFCSHAARYHSPNFNRDSFVDNIHMIYKSLQGRATIKEIGVALEKLNIHYSNSDHSKYPPKVIEKCTKHNFWLFLEKSIQIDHVSRFL